MYELGEIKQEKNKPQDAVKYFEAAKRLAETAGKVSKTYTFERATFKQKIDETLIALAQ